MHSMSPPATNAFRSGWFHGANIPAFSPKPAHARKKWGTKMGPKFAPPEQGFMVAPHSDGPRNGGPIAAPFLGPPAASHDPCFWSSSTARLARNLAPTMNQLAVASNAARCKNRLAGQQCGTECVGLAADQGERDTGFLGPPGPGRSTGGQCLRSFVLRPRRQGRASGWQLRRPFKSKAARLRGLCSPFQERTK